MVIAHARRVSDCRLNASRSRASRGDCSVMPCVSSHPMRRPLSASHNANARLSYGVPGRRLAAQRSACAPPSARTAERAGAANQPPAGRSTHPRVSVACRFKRPARRRARHIAHTYSFPGSAAPAPRPADWCRARGSAPAAPAVQPKAPGSMKQLACSCRRRPRRQAAARRYLPYLLLFWCSTGGGRCGEHDERRRASIGGLVVGERGVFCSGGASRPGPGSSAPSPSWSPSLAANCCCSRPLLWATACANVHVQSCPRLSADRSTKSFSLPCTLAAPHTQSAPTPANTHASFTSCGSSLSCGPVRVRRVPLRPRLPPWAGSQPRARLLSCTFSNPQPRRTPCLPPSR